MIDHAPTHKLPTLPDDADAIAVGVTGDAAPASDAGGDDPGTYGDNASTTELSGDSGVPDGEVRDTSQVVEKTSAWSEEELSTGGRVATDESPKLPEWVGAFPAGELFTVNGWECKTLHIGCEEGNWLVLMQPQRLLGRFVPKSRNAKRADFKALVRKVGKKKAKSLVQGQAHAS